MVSIKQNPSAFVRLPDFRNLGVMLRILLLVNGMVALASIVRANDWASAWQQLVEMSAIVQPLLLLSLLVLYALCGALSRLSYRLGAACVATIELTLALLIPSISDANPGH
jgi:two-component system sensor histidine kinase AlgZ